MNPSHPKPPITPPLLAEQRDLLRVLGYGFLQNNHAQKALPLFELLHSLDPSDVRDALSLAHARIRTGRAEQALPLLQDMVRGMRNCAAAWLLRAQALAQLGRAPEAARCMRFFVALRARSKAEV